MTVREPSTTLAETLEERIEYPFAIGFRVGDEIEKFVHFRQMEDAEQGAILAESVSAVVTRWVALPPWSQEYLMNAMTPGWRQVTYFYTS